MTALTAGSLRLYLIVAGAGPRTVEAALARYPLDSLKQLNRPSGES